MKKVLSTSLLLITLFLMIGCGGSGSSGAVAQSQNASDILEGKTLYYSDNMLDDPEGYFANIFSKNTMVEKEYDQEGNVLYAPETHSMRYEGKNIIFSEEGISFSCSVARMTESTIIECKLADESLTIVLWDTIELAKANPDTESGESAKTMLLGKTFYYTDDWVNDYDGYYTDMFSEETIVSNTYDADGIENNAPNHWTVKYKGTNIIRKDEIGFVTICSVERMNESIVLDCIVEGDYSYTSIFWETLKDANTHRYD